VSIAMTCRDQVRETFRNLAHSTGRDTFSPSEVVAAMRRDGTPYADSTIRTHIVSRMCTDAPDHHAVVYQDLERIGRGLYRLRGSEAAEVASNTPSSFPRITETPRLRPNMQDGYGRANAEEMPGTLVGEIGLMALGFIPHDLLLRNVDVVLPDGIGIEWDTVGDVSDTPGIYAFTVGTAGSTHVTYVGLTGHLWMVTKGRLPNGGARGGQRYGRPKHAGVTRKRVNLLVAEQVRLGRAVRHWVRPVQIEQDEDLRSRLRRDEESLIQRWQLRSTGWNRG